MAGSDPIDLFQGEKVIGFLSRSRAVNEPPTPTDERCCVVSLQRSPKGKPSHPNLRVRRWRQTARQRAATRGSQVKRGGAGG